MTSSRKCSAGLPSGPRARATSSAIGARASGEVGLRVLVDRDRAGEKRAVVEQLQLLTLGLAHQPPGELDPVAGEAGAGAGQQAQDHLGDRPGIRVVVAPGAGLERLDPRLEALDARAQAGRGKGEPNTAAQPVWPAVGAASSLSPGTESDMLIVTRL